ncbi:MAG: ABC transporter substrate-binding protein [Clostridiaceae bacterium]|nr:ABC transporter substrate-binding protein [Clostridiaceae bacterium]
MRKWKKCALAAVLAALCALSTACGIIGGDEEQGPVDNVKVSDAYFGLAWYQNGTLNPVLDNTNINRVLCEALYEGLFEVTSNFTAENVLCESYEGDGTTFTFTLRGDVTFWSGEPLTAADVVASLEAAHYNESSPFYNRLTEVSSIEAVGTNQVRIVLSSPNINFPRLLDIPIYREGSADSGSFADGTGPYRPVEGENQWTLEANENWHGGFLGSIRHITLVTMTRADTALSSFQTGDVSLMRASRIDPNPPNVGGSVDTVQTASASLHYLGFNYNDSLLSSSGVRRALSAALSRQSLCETQLQTFADPAILPVNPQPADSSLSLNMSADPNGAAQLLREALQSDTGGSSEDEPSDTEDEYTDDEYTGEGDGSGGESDSGETESDGSSSPSGVGSEAETVLSIRLLVNSDNAFKVAAAQQIAASWNALDGVSVTVDAQPYETFVSRLQSGDFDVYYGETQLTADFDLRPLLSSGGSLNYGGYSGESMASAIAAMRSGDNVVGFYQTFLEEMPIVPIAFECDQIIIRKGLIDNYQPAPYNAFAGLETWTSPE